VQFELLADAVAELKHNQQVKLFLGSAQRLARVRVLGEERIKQGMTGWIQLALEHPIVTARGDHFILRRPSPGATLGGGKVADPHPKRRHRRKDVSILNNLESLLQGSPSDVLDQTLTALGPVPLNQAIKQSGLDPSLAREALTELEKTGRLRALEDGSLDSEASILIISEVAWLDFRSRIEQVLMDYHERNPLRAGMPREELKSRLRQDSRVFNGLLVRAIEEGWVLEKGAQLQSINHFIELNQEDLERVRLLADKFNAKPFGPPSFKECVEFVGDDLMAYLLESEQFIQVSPDVVFQSDTYVQMVNEINNLLTKRGKISVAEVRDYFKTTRKYALALMEHLDAIGVTIRDGDYRQLAPDELP
jgi:selenocysteine-specific elongation factor